MLLPFSPCWGTRGSTLPSKTLDGPWELLEAGVAQTSTPSLYDLTRGLVSAASDVNVSRNVRTIPELDSSTTSFDAMPQRRPHEWMWTGWLMKCCWSANCSSSAQTAFREEMRTPSSPKREPNSQLQRPTWMLMYSVAFERTIPDVLEESVRLSTRSRSATSTSPPGETLNPCNDSSFRDHPAKCTSNASRASQSAVCMEASPSSPLAACVGR